MPRAKANKKKTATKKAAPSEASRKSPRKGKSPSKSQAKKTRKEHDTESSASTESLADRTAIEKEEIKALKEKIKYEEHLIKILENELSNKRFEAAQNGPMKKARTVGEGLDYLKQTQCDYTQYANIESHQEEMKELTDRLKILAEITGTEICDISKSAVGASKTKYVVDQSLVTDDDRNVNFSVTFTTADTLKLSSMDDLSCKVGKGLNESFKRFVEICLSKEDLGMLVESLQQYKKITDDLTNLCLETYKKFGKKKLVETTQVKSTKTYKLVYSDLSKNILLTISFTPVFELQEVYFETKVEPQDQGKWIKAEHGDLIDKITQAQTCTGELIEAIDALGRHIEKRICLNKSLY